MRGIVDAQGRPLVASERRPITAQHITRQAIWTQEAHREVRREHDDDGHHDTSMHVWGVCWIKLPLGVGQPVTISKASVWRGQQQGDAGPWTGSTSSPGDGSTASLFVVGDTIPDYAGVQCRVRSLSSDNPVFAHHFAGNEIRVEVKRGGPRFMGWVMVTVFGGLR